MSGKSKKELAQAQSDYNDLLISYDSAVYRAQFAEKKVEQLIAENEKLQNTLTAVLVAQVFTKNKILYPQEKALN